MTKGQTLMLVRGVHTAIYVGMAAAVFASLYAGIVGARGAWLWVALGLVTIEIVVFVAGGMKCPLTAMAKKYGAKPGHDTFFPERITRHTLHIFGPIIVVSLLLLAARWFGALG